MRLGPVLVRSLTETISYILTNIHRTNEHEQMKREKNKNGFTVRVFTFVSSNRTNRNSTKHTVKNMFDLRSCYSHRVCANRDITSNRLIRKGIEKYFWRWKMFEMQNIGTMLITPIISSPNWRRHFVIGPSHLKLITYFFIDLSWSAFDCRWSPTFVSHLARTSMQPIDFLLIFFSIHSP